MPSNLGTAQMHKARKGRKEKQMSSYDRITYCDVVECCETCPRYGDDCDGDFDEEGNE